MTPQVADMPNSRPPPTVDDLPLRLVQLEASQTMLQREVSQGVNNLTSAVQAVQAEQRHQSTQMGELVRLQQAFLDHSAGLDRLARAIEAQGQEFRSYRESQHAAFEAYRTAANTAQQNVQREVTEFQGRFRGIWMAGGLTVTLGTALVLLGWNQLVTSIADAKAERVALEARRQAAHDADVARLQRQMDDTRARVDNLEGTRGAR
jgi:hypothetical protein